MADPCDAHPTLISASPRLGGRPLCLYSVALVFLRVAASPRAIPLPATLQVCVRLAVHMGTHRSAVPTVQRAVVPHGPISIQPRGNTEVNGHAKTRRKSREVVGKSDSPRHRAFHSLFSAPPPLCGSPVSVFLGLDSPPRLGVSACRSPPDHPTASLQRCGMDGDERHLVPPIRFPSQRLCASAGIPGSLPDNRRKHLQPTWRWQVWSSSAH
jgi:hypothetical protein